jgi:hypothetical protein
LIDVDLEGLRERETMRGNDAYVEELIQVTVVVEIAGAEANAKLSASCPACYMVICRPQLHFLYSVADVHWVSS